MHKHHAWFSHCFCRIGSGAYIIHSSKGKVILLQKVWVQPENVYAVHGNSPVLLVVTQTMHEREITHGVVELWFWCATTASNVCLSTTCCTLFPTN